MSTSKSQRIGIWVIAIVMTIGTIGSFFVVILANDNAQKDQQEYTELQKQYNDLYSEYQKKIDEQATQLSKKYYSDFSKYSDQVKPFDKNSVKNVTTKDLKIGTGKELKKDTKYSAYYIGWAPDGEIFDQSIDGKTLKSPIQGGNFIDGWNEGVLGMKLGGVRLLTIPSDKAYGETGSGDQIPPNTPLKFIVMAIPSPEEIPLPDFSGLGQ